MELKPCPFCGMAVANCKTVAEHEIVDKGDASYEWCSTHYDVVCSVHSGGCGASTGKDNATPEAAAEAWNRRVNDG